MAIGVWKRCSILLPTAAALATVILYCFLVQQSGAKQLWSSDELFRTSKSTDKVTLDQGIPSPDLRDLTILLHPEKHTHRKPQRTELQWNITTGIRRPDGVAKRVYLVNEQFPGPSIEVRSGDELIVNVRNRLQDEDVAIHWHGLRIENEMDGVVGLTQCGIAPGKEMSYALRIPEDQFGSFWWHSHAETQRADGLFGSLTVHKPVSGGLETETVVYGYEDEQVLMVGDWYHRPAVDVLGSYVDWTMFKIEPVPDSMLLNGFGSFNCSMALRSRPLDCESSIIPSLAISKRTRLRIVNTGSLTGFSIATSGYSMTLIQVDGGHTVQAVTSRSIGTLYPGERIDVVLERNEDVNPWIQISLNRENMGFPNLALSDQQQFPIASLAAWKTQPQSTVRGQIKVERVDLSRLNGTDIRPEVLANEADEKVLLYATISYLTRFNYRPKGFLNHTSWSPSASIKPPLVALDRKDWPKEASVLAPEVAMGHTVELVINNMDDKGHPLHFHGHDFFVIASHRPSRMGAFEQYNPFDSNEEPAGAPMNLESPVMKDTVYVPSMGYVVLRFRADNPGLWLLHCHVLWHGAVGMNMAFEVTDGFGTALDAIAKERIARMCDA